MSEGGSTASWGSGSEASNVDSDDDEVDSLADEGCADEAYWKEENAADAWLARFPGGTSVLYPQLFVVKPRGGKVLTSSRYPNNKSLLQFPSEIRNRIYKHYFDRDMEVKHLDERHAPFRDREGTEMQTICLSSENVELKFWLSTALLQTSRQLRYEAMFIFFSNRVITVEWLPVLPRFVDFLGKEGCAMVRYLDIWDILNHQGDDNDGYRGIISSIKRFSGLQHLRITLSLGKHRSGLWSDRTWSWFDQNEWKHDGTLKKQAVPKIRSEDIERYWPEFEDLKNLEAQKFTFAVETPWADKYLEFDKSHGAYPEISQSMQTHAACAQSAPSSANHATFSISSQVVEAFQATETRPRSGALNANTDYDGEDSRSPTWQDCDTLTNKAIPLYNFLQDIFHNDVRLWPEIEQISLRNFVTFPTARKSTGGIMRNCVFCYLSGRHCGHHAVPDQPPFEPTRLEGDAEEDDGKTLQTRFEDLSYVDMREVCRDTVQWLENADSLAYWNANVISFLKIAAIFDYLGWPEIPNREVLARLDAAVEAGWTGKRLDKDEVPPWDVLYREVHSRYSFRVGARSS